MSPAQTGEDRLAAIHRFTVALFVALAAARLGYIAACGTPLQESFGHLLWAVPALTIGTYFTYVRSHAIISGLFNGLGLLGIGFTGSVLASVLTVYSGRRFPLTDHALAAVDRALGFDWVALLQLFDRHPWLNTILQAAYRSIIAQVLLIIVALALTGQAERVYRFLTATNLALLTTCIASVFFPALGPYVTYGVSPADHPDIALVSAGKTSDAILWLRAAVFTDPVPSFAVGLIWFPSFHAATAAIYAWATWRTPVVRWIGLALNVLMLIATPIHGDHYLVDVLSGLAVAAAAVAATTWMFGRIRHARAPALAAAGASV